MIPFTPDQVTDWRQVFLDLKRAGKELSEVGELTHINESTLKNARTGGTLSYEKGANVIALWQAITRATQVPTKLKTLDITHEESNAHCSSESV